MVKLARAREEKTLGLLDYTYWIFGRPKIGKTSLLSVPEAYFFMSEKGGKSLSLRASLVKNWVEFRQYVRLARELDVPAVIDVAEAFYGYAYKQVLKDLKKPNGSPEWGEWSTIRFEFISVMQDLMNATPGFFAISHAGESERATVDGKIKDIHPAGITGQTLEDFGGKFDVIAYYHYFRKRRALMIRTSSDSVYVGCRLNGHFLFKDGTPMTVIPMGDSEIEAWDLFQKAFDNSFTQDEVDEFFGTVKKRVSKSVGNGSQRKRRVKLRTRK